MLGKSAYKGKPMITIKKDENDHYPFFCGLNKARPILENIEEIKKFVEENNK